MLYSMFPLTSETHSIYVGTIELRVVWRQIFVFNWRPLCRSSRLLNRVSHFWSILSLVCILADLLSGIAQSISLCTHLETGLMLSIHQLTLTWFLDGGRFLSGHNLYTIQQGMVQIIASSTTALLKNGLSTTCNGEGQSNFLTIITLLVGRMPLLTGGLLLVRRRWSSSLFAMFMPINW